VQTKTEAKREFEGIQQLLAMLVVLRVDHQIAQVDMQLHERWGILCHQWFANHEMIEQLNGGGAF